MNVVDNNLNTKTNSSIRNDATVSFDFKNSVPNDVINTSNYSRFNNDGGAATEEISLDEYDYKPVPSYGTGKTYNYEGRLSNGELLSEYHFEEVLRIAKEYDDSLADLKKERDYLSEIDNNIRYELALANPDLDPNSEEYKKEYERLLNMYYMKEKMSFDEFNNRVNEIDDEIARIEGDLDVIYGNFDLTEEEQAAELIDQCLALESRMREYDEFIEEFGEDTQKLVDDAISWYQSKYGSTASEQEMVVAYCDKLEQEGKFWIKYGMEREEFEATRYMLENKEIIQYYLDNMSEMLYDATGKTFEEIKADRYVNTDLGEGKYTEGYEEFIEFGAGSKEYYVNDEESLAN
jgi:hypothetical protein